MKVLFDKPKSMTGKPFHYCPGCGHSVIHRIIGEIVDELDIREKTIMVAPVGCAVFAYDYFDFDVVEAPHGRTPAVATGIKRVLPDRIVISYQGDGDLAAIGMAETLHAANRDEQITVIFVNNANYGMTGGQMAPTTVLNQKTTTSPFGRDAATFGYPILVPELLSGLMGKRFLARSAVYGAKEVLTTKRLIKKAIQRQMRGEGYSLVEVLSNCNTNWHMTPIAANKYIEDELTDIYKLGIIEEDD